MRIMFGAAVLAAIALLTPMKAGALEAGTAAAIYRNAGPAHRLSDPELALIYGRALPDQVYAMQRQLSRIEMYMAGGNAVEVIGDLARLTNPPLFLMDPEINFRNAVFNPANPGSIMDASGAMLIRIPRNMQDANVYDMVVRDSLGNSINSVSVRGINFGGTTLRVTPRP